MCKFDDFLLRNSIKKEKIESILYQNLILSLFMDIFIFLEQEDNKQKLRDKLLTISKISLEKKFLKEFIDSNTNKILNEEEYNIFIDLIYAYLRKSNLREKIKIEIKKGLLKTQINSCNICGKQINLDTIEVDHIVPFKYVGDELNNNYQGLCKNCNLKKSDKLVFLNKIFEL
jgi:hypothetical protein